MNRGAWGLQSMGSGPPEAAEQQQGQRMYAHT